MTINETLKMLPPEAKKEVADFVEFIAQKYLKKKSKTNQGKRTIKRYQPGKILLLNQTNRRP